MKKYIIPMLALLLIAGATNAQTSDKKPIKAASATSASTKKAVTSVKHENTASVTPQKSATKSNPSSNVNIIKSQSPPGKQKVNSSAVGSYGSVKRGPFF